MPCRRKKVKRANLQRSLYAFKSWIRGDIMAKGHKAFSVFISVDNLTNVAVQRLYESIQIFYPVNYSSNPRRVGVFNMGGM